MKYPLLDQRWLFFTPGSPRKSPGPTRSSVPCCSWAGSQHLTTARCGPFRESCAPAAWLDGFIVGWWVLDGYLTWWLNGWLMDYFWVWPVTWLVALLIFLPCYEVYVGCVFWVRNGEAAKFLSSCLLGLTSVPLSDLLSLLDNYQLTITMGWDRIVWTIIHLTLGSTALTLVFNFALDSCLPMLCLCWVQWSWFIYTW